MPRPTPPSASNVRPADFDEIRRRFSNRTEVPLSSAELCKMQQGQISASNLRPIDPDDRRIFDGPVDLIELYRAGLKPPSRRERISDWLADTYSADPRGLAWFAATLFPIAAAAFAIGYFGGRELLALVLR